jgi:hypothetical protein
VEGETATVQTWVEQLTFDDPDRRVPKDLSDRLDVSAKNTMRINTQGKVLAHDKIKAMIEMGGLSGGAGAAPTERRPWLSCPKDPVETGHTWKETLLVPLTGVSDSIEANVEYTLDSIQTVDGETVAVVSYKNTIDEKDLPYIPIQQGKQVQLTYDLNMQTYQKQGAGTIHFNIDKGYITSFESSSEMKIHITGESRLNDSVLPVNNIMKFTMKSKGTVSTAKPESLQNEDPKGQGETHEAKQ